MLKVRLTRLSTEWSKLCTSKITAKALVAAVAAGALLAAATAPAPAASAASRPAIKTLANLAVKGRAPKTGYSRQLFSDGWGQIGSCDTRNFILKRDLTQVTWRSNGTCLVASGTLNDPYTGRVIHFIRGLKSSLAVQIDHVVPVSDAWQKGAQQISSAQRYSFYNDPLNLLAVDGPTNEAKSDSDAASWLPPNKSFRCAYVARQIAVKAKYHLWVTAAEKSAMQGILAACPSQPLPSN
jgi:hypothetical protein